MWHPPFVVPLRPNHAEMHFLLVTEYQMLEEPILNKVFVNARQDCITGVILGQELMIELIKMNSSRWVSGNPEMKLRPDQ